MSKNLALALLLVPALAFAADPATLETRSALHAFAIDVIPVADAVRYVARVTDLKTGELLHEASLGTGVTAAESFNESLNRRIKITVRPTINGLSASVSIEKDSVVIDAMEARWTMTPVRPRTGVLRVGGDVKAPVVTHRVEPFYPEEARAARISGIVILEVIIDKAGVVRDAVVLKPLPFGLDQAAIDAVRQWKFRPATMNGEPVDVVFNLTVNFKLDKPAS
jgi:TonB family protein